ncbi:30S ribosomal protein S6 [Candidatus Uhrbacteria bacterium]|nr:30S ribosomal protein S6 [Candidatus Uhrbacteria bacterium]
MIYEFMYIIPSKFSDSEIDGVINQVAGVFEKHGAKVEQSQNLGKLKFAYPIKKVRHGTYVLAYISAEAEAVAKIDKDIRLTDEVLRHMIVKREKGIPTAKYEFKPGSYQEPLDAEGKRAVARKPRKPKVVESPDRLSTEELDRKLDEILDKDINV